MARRLGWPSTHIGLLVIALGMVAAPQANAQARIVAHEQPADELLVKFRSGASDAQAEAVAREHGARETRRFRAPRKAAHAAIGRWRHVKLAPGQSANQAMERLERQPLVEAVERHYGVRASCRVHATSFGDG